MSDQQKSLDILDGSFWFWETIEEAIRPNISELSDKEVTSVLMILAANFKGSNDFNDLLIKEIELRHADFS